MAATRLRAILARWLRAASRRRGPAAPLAGLLGGVLAAGGGCAEAADLPADEADAMYHLFDGGGVRADGPALLVRKSLADKVSFSGSYYVDAVSNASIDVVTQASPYHETRTEYGLGADYVYENALMSLTATHSKEPDYTAEGTNFDVAQDVFGGLTTINVGFSRGHDTVGKTRDPSFSAVADHWQYRLGATQILTPRLLVSANLESISDSGYLGSPYRAARVFGALVPERVPDTRSSRAIKFSAIGDVDGHSSLRASYRYFWDNWDVRASTAEVGYSRYVGGNWLADASVRFYAQERALFYSDNATADTQYVTRNRQLGTFTSSGVGGKATYTAYKVPASYDVKLTASYEWLRFKYSDYTDLRTGLPYSFDANVLELYVTATF